VKGAVGVLLLKAEFHRKVSMVRGEGNGHDGLGGNMVDGVVFAHDHTGCGSLNVQSVFRHQLAGLA